MDANGGQLGYCADTFGDDECRRRNRHCSCLQGLLTCVTSFFCRWPVACRAVASPANPSYCRRSMSITRTFRHRLRTPRAEWSGPSMAGDRLPSTIIPPHFDSCDLIVYWVFGGATPVLSIYSAHETGGYGGCAITLTAVDFATIRYQRVPTSASTGSDLCQAWDKNGKLFLNSSIAYTGIAPGSNARGMLLATQRLHLTPPIPGILNPRSRKRGASDHRAESCRMSGELEVRFGK